MKKTIKYLERGGLYVFLLFIFWLATQLVIPKVQYYVFNSSISKPGENDTLNISELEMTQLRKKVDDLNRKLDRLTPGNAFLIINTTENTFKLYKNSQVIWSGLCSTGSFVKLEVDSTQSWLFETPKGMLTVKDKIVNPVWRKPDWAFIEEGLPVPPENHSSRFERNVLGDYALSLGNGYLIHGTLYQRLIGMPVTHGCVRLGDNDLEMVYTTLQIGSRVFIY